MRRLLQFLENFRHSSKMVPCDENFSFHDTIMSKEKAADRQAVVGSAFGESATDRLQSNLQVSEGDIFPASFLFSQEGGYC